MDWMKNWKFKRNVFIFYELIVKYILEMERVVRILFYFKIGVNENWIEGYLKNKWRIKE